MSEMEPIIVDLDRQTVATFIRSDGDKDDYVVLADANRIKDRCGSARGGRWPHPLPIARASVGYVNEDTPYLIINDPSFSANLIAGGAKIIPLQVSAKDVDVLCRLVDCCDRPQHVSYYTMNLANRLKRMGPIIRRGFPAKDYV